MAMAADQALGMAGAMASSFAFPFPEPRRLDAVTLAHVRAAENVRTMAGYLLRGPDLQVLLQRTPFLAEDARHLREYYDGLPLDVRLDLLVGLAATAEFLQSTRLCTREQFPWLRRALDVYSVAVGAVCLFPREVFYQLHRLCWLQSTRQALREVGPPPPWPLSSATQAAAADAFQSLVGQIRGDAGAASGGDRGGWRSSSAGKAAAAASGLALLVASAGTIAWLLGEAGRARLAQKAVVEFESLRGRAKRCFLVLVDMPKRHLMLRATPGEGLQAQEHTAVALLEGTRM